MLIFREDLTLDRMEWKTFLRSNTQLRMKPVSDHSRKGAQMVCLSNPLEGSLVRGVEVALALEVALGGGRGITLLKCLKSAHIDSQYGRE